MMSGLTSGLIGVGVLVGMVVVRVEELLVLRDVTVCCEALRSLPVKLARDVLEREAVRFDRTVKVRDLGSRFFSIPPVGDLDCF